MRSRAQRSVLSGAAASPPSRMSHVSSSGGADVAYLERDEDLGDSATLTAIAAKRRLDPQSTRKTQE